MNPMRRAVVRAALSASRVPSCKTSTLGVATQVLAPKFITSNAVRYFSQTLRFANEEVSAPTPSQEGETRPVGNNSAGAETEHGIFIRNMVFEANEDHLREAFEKYGEVTKVTVARDSRGLSRGYGFVWFTTKEAQEQAVAETDSSFWHGRRIQVALRAARSSPKDRTRRQGGEGPTRSLYIGNIPYETTDAELNRIFKELENVQDVRVAVDRTTGWPRGFAHADFPDAEACTAAMEKLRGTTIGGRELRLDYADETKAKPLLQ